MSRLTRLGPLAGGLLARPALAQSGVAGRGVDVVPAERVARMTMSLELGPAGLTGRRSQSELVLSRALTAPSALTAGRDVEVASAVGMPLGAVCSSGDGRDGTASCGVRRRHAVVPRGFRCQVRWVHAATMQAARAALAGLAAVVALVVDVAVVRMALAVDRLHETVVEVTMRSHGALVCGGVLPVARVGDSPRPVPAAVGALLDPAPEAGRKAGIPELDGGSHVAIIAGRGRCM